jgi:hypothetical protein
MVVVAEPEPRRRDMSTVGFFFHARTTSSRGCSSYHDHFNDMGRFHPVLMSKLDLAIPAEFKVADGNAIRSVNSRPPAKFNLICTYQKIDSFDTWYGRQTWLR